MDDVCSHTGCISSAVARKGLRENVDTRHCQRGRRQCWKRLSVLPREGSYRGHDRANMGAQALDSVVEGIKFVRKMTAALRTEKVISEEELPGSQVQSDAELGDYVRNNAWGHHASCTCPIGAKEKGGVLTSDFQVHGTRGLRVVDASVFPRIPGFFIVSAVYMIGEKAADAILADNR